MSQLIFVTALEIFILKMLLDDSRSTVCIAFSAYRANGFFSKSNSSEKLSVTIERWIPRAAAEKIGKMR
jgi:hypothetical protein